LHDLFGLVEHRFRFGLDAIISKCPSVGWKLLVALAPGLHPIIEPSAFPTWRDLSADRRMRGLSVTENHREIGARMFEQAWVTQAAFWHDNASGTPPERDLVFC